MCMILVKNMKLVLQKCKQTKTRVNLNGKRVLSKKRNTIPRCGFELSMSGLQLDALTTDAHVIQTGKVLAA